MDYRALIFDDNQGIRRLLWTVFDIRGYEVFTFPHPGLCPLNRVDNCPCPKDESCSDVIITDIEMPILNGFDFIAQQVEKGCKCNNIAIMSGKITDDILVRAKLLNLQVFHKPFTIEQLTEWLDRIEKDIAPRRKLTDWHLKRK